LDIDQPFHKGEAIHVGMSRGKITQMPDALS
jgi:hypothetical protein